MDCAEQTCVITCRTCSLTHADALVCADGEQMFQLIHADEDERKT